MEGQYDNGHAINNGPPAKHTQFLDLTNGEGGERDDDEEMPTVVPTASIRRTAPSSSKGRDKFDPNTPGRVVETGQEQTGRWTKQEHEAFLSALQMYGKEWKKVAAKVKTRTVVQTRTHAQKYFQKLAKVVETGGKDSTGSIEMGVRASEGKRSTSIKKKQRVSVAAKNPPQRQTSLTSAAQLISKLSGGTDSAAAAATVHGGVSPFGLTGVPLGTSGTSAYLRQKQAGILSSANSGILKNSLLAPHGFSSFNPASKNENTSFSPLSSGNNSAFMQPQSIPQGFQMKIKAPEHDASIKQGKFPEPSPAACGKRKLAEIAAARMLAGVAAVGGQPLLGSTTEDGTATPPPEKEPSLHIPAPPQIDKVENSGVKKSMGLSLQIVNPEALGISYGQQKERKDGQASPVTPWEGELKALMSVEKQKEPAKQADSNLPKAPRIDTFGSSSGGLHPICGPGSAFDRNPLHKAVCELDLAVVQSELTSRPVEAFQRRDKAGYCAIHSACALCMKDPMNSSIATDIVRALIAAGADATICDSDGNTPLHWAARAGDRGTAELLLLRNCPKGMFILQLNF